MISTNLLKNFSQRSWGTCSKPDFDLYDVHDKKLDTLGLVTLPIFYGGTQLLQEFVVTDGISEDCILGWDAIRSHGFTVDGENQSIYLAREASCQVASPEISIVSKQRVKVPRQSILVIEAKTKGSFLLQSQI